MQIDLKDRDKKTATEKKIQLENMHDTMIQRQTLWEVKKRTNTISKPRPTIKFFLSIKSDLYLAFHELDLVSW